MGEHLLLVALGPVQEFIAQARRTRDLWFGSTLLSELSRAVARSLAARAELIFPALDVQSPELEACWGPSRSSGAPPLNVANKILVRVHKEHDPRDLARGARKAAQDTWTRVADRVRRENGGLLPKGEGLERAWKEQIDTFLEFGAAWAPLDEGYSNARAAVERALAGRKNLRDFPAWTQQRETVPKSSLDGARETVLAPKADRAPDRAARLRIPPGEELDAVGLVKRAGGNPEQFVPVGNVALSAWLEAAGSATDSQTQSAFRGLEQACRSLRGLSRIDRNLRVVSNFPFDAQVLLEDRWPGTFEELGEGDASQARAWGEEHVRPLLRRMSEPHPYVACLVADGDAIGKTLEALGEVQDQRRFALELAEFARRARAVVEEDHKGVLVYAGGDDVLAFVCLTDALACAKGLRDAFEKIMRGALPGRADSELPTLSVGLGIGHLLESMGDLLDLGRQAEKAAKAAHLPVGESRNALAVHIDKRSGGEHCWRAQWPANPIERLQADLELLAGQLSTKKVYEIKQFLLRMPKPDGLESPEAWASILERDLARTLARAQRGLPDDDPDESSDGGSAGLTLDAVGLVLTGDYAARLGAAHNWVSRLLTARMFAAAQPRVRSEDS